MLTRMGPLHLRRYRAERLLRHEFSALRSKVLAVVRSKLRAKGIALDPADLEACYAQAWHGLYATVLDGQAIDDPSAWLVLVTFRRAIDESRSAARHGFDPNDAKIDRLQDRLATPEQEFAIQLDDRQRLRQVFEGMRISLSKREREAATLCYLQGLSRAQAAAQMGISEARMRKLMDGPGEQRPGVAGKIGELLDAIDAGSWCEQQSSLMRAYAFGMLDHQGERYALAVAHCRACPACRAHVAALRGLAALLPLPLPRFAAMHGSPTSLERATNAATHTGRAISTAKLAIGTLLLVGGAYTVSGASLPRHIDRTPAPSSLSASSIISASPLSTGQTLARVTLAAHEAPAPHRPTAHVHLLAKSSTGHVSARASIYGPKASVLGLRAPEFGPERSPSPWASDATASRSQPANSQRANSQPANPQPANSRARNLHATREFGLEQLVPLRGQGRVRHDHHALPIP